MTPEHNNTCQLIISKCLHETTVKMWLETTKKKMKEKRKFIIFQLYRRKGVVNKIVYFKITKVLLRQLSPSVVV